MDKGTEASPCPVHLRVVSWMLEGPVEKGWGQQEPQREPGPEGLAH